MKKRKTISIFATTFVIFGILGFILQLKITQASNEVEVSLSSSKNAFYQGELIPVDTKVLNNLAVSIYLEGSENSISIKIAKSKDGEYKLYVPPTTSKTAISVDGILMKSEIKTKEAFICQKEILWNKNFLPETKNLSPEAAKSYIEGKILADYAFPEAGVYLIKAVTTVIKDKKPVYLESEPIEITIVEPKGDDLEVWTLMKNNSDIGYFIQTGELVRGKYHKPEERVKFQAEVEDILQKYPNSFYAQSLRQSLDKFKVNEAKRQEFIEKMKVQQKPKS